MIKTIQVMLMHLANMVKNTLNDASKTKSLE